jgi:hypothetical protein
MCPTGPRAASIAPTITAIALPSADHWPDDLRLSYVEPQFVCGACGKRGADVRPGKAARSGDGVSIGHAAPIQWNSSIEGSPPLAAGSRLGRKRRKDGN